MPEKTVKTREGSTKRANLNPGLSSFGPLVESPADKIQQKNILTRLAALFSKKRPYILHGGTALNLLFLEARGRIPNDIDLRCHDLEASREDLLSQGYQPIAKPGPIPIHSFVDENGIEIDLSQNGIGYPTCEYNIGEVSVTSYGFHTLFAEKLLALARKRTLKDLYDAFGCIQVPCNAAEIRRRAISIGKNGGVDPTVLADRSFTIEKAGGPIRTSQEIKPHEMLSMVRYFATRVFGPA